MAALNPIICGRKICAGCRCWRHIYEFPCHNRDPLKLYARCRNCSSAYHKDWMARNPEKVKGYQSEYRTRAREEILRKGREKARERRNDPETAALMREQALASWRKVREDPVRWAQRKADQRMNYRLRKMREGTPVNPVSEKSYAKKNGRPGLARGARTLPTAPLAVAILAWLGGNTGVPLTNGEHGVKRAEYDVLFAAGFDQLGELCGMPGRTLRAIAHGERETLRYETADRICVALNLPLSLVYSDDL